MAPTAQRIRFCTSRDGTRIAYATSGTGPPLLWGAHWVHQLELDWESPVWSPWLTLLTRRHTVVRYDLRGCGLSDRKEVEFSFEKLVEDLEAVADATGIRKFGYFGMAGGAAIGMTYAVRHPERISRLILYGAYIRNRFALKLTADEVETELAELKVIERGGVNENPAYANFFASLHIPDATPEQTRSYNELLRLTTSAANGVRLLSTFWKADLADVVPRIRCPTLVLQPRNESV